MGDVDLVWVRCFQWKGRDVFTLARESAPTRWLTAADVREILGDEPPVVAYDDSGPGGALIFPADECRHGSRHPLDVMLAEQLRTAILRRAQAAACPAEAFPEPGAPDVDADDFAEPAGGEGARVATEEAAWEAQIRAAATRAPVTEDRTDILWGGWRPGDRFVISPDDDEGKRWAAIHLWITACPLPGRVIDRVRLHTGIGGGDLALLVQIEGRPERVVVRVGVLCATAKKVGA